MPKDDIINDYHIDFLNSIGNGDRVANVRMVNSSEPKCFQHNETGISCDPKLIKDARNILPFRVVKYLPMSPVVDQIINTTCSADQSLFLVSHKIRETSRSYYGNHNDSGGHHRSRFAWVSKDILSNQQFGLFDAHPNYDKHISDYFRESSGSNDGDLSLRGITSHSTAWSNSRDMDASDFLSRGLIPYTKDMRGKAHTRSSTMWSVKFANEIFTKKQVYNKQYEADNYGIKELSARLYHILRRISRLLKIDAKIPEELEEFNRKFALTNSTLPSNIKFKKVLTDKELRDYAKDFCISNALLTIPKEFRISTALMKRIKDNDDKISCNYIRGILFPITAPFQLNRVSHYNTPQIYASIFSHVEKRGLLALSKALPTLHNQHFDATDVFNFYASRIYVNLLSYVALGVHYTIRYPGFKEEVHAIGNKQFVNNCNLYLYSLLLEVIISLHDTNSLLQNITAQLMMLKTDASEEFDEYVELLAELYSIIGCCKSRISKLSLINATAGSDRLSPIVSGHITRTLSDVSYQGRYQRPESSALSSYITAVQRKEEYNDMWRIAIRKAIQRKEGKPNGN